MTPDEFAASIATADQTEPAEMCWMYRVEDRILTWGGGMLLAALFALDWLHY